MESVIKKLGKTSVTVEKDYHSSKKEYNKLTVVEEQGTFKTYISRKPIPVGIALTNREYWIPFSGVLESITFDYLKFKKDYASGKAIEDNAIITRHILDRNIERIKIALKAISEEELDDNAVIERTIKDRNITSNKIAQENILTEHFAKKSVITAILADYAITAIKLADNSVTTRAIVNENVTQEKLAAGSVSGPKIVDKTITNSKIADDTIELEKLSTTLQNIINSVTNVPEDLIRLNEIDNELKKLIVAESVRATNAENINTQLITNEVARLDETDNKIKEKLNDKTNEINIAKEEALQAIAENEQSVITNFNAQRVTPEMLSESTKQLIEASGGGTITNLADDEDLTSVDDGTGSNVLKFKDKAYNPLIYNGMGRKILRKNIVDGVNVLTQSMINTANVIYVIQYDYIIGENITIPANCVLKFEGGSINNSGNYTLTGQDTVVIAGVTKIIDANIKIGGTWKAGWAFPEWFGAKGDGESDDSLSFRKTFENFSNVILHKKTYCMHMVPVKDLNLVGNGATLKYNGPILGQGEPHFNHRLNILVSRAGTPLETPGSPHTRTTPQFDTFRVTGVNFFFDGQNKRIYPFPDYQTQLSRGVFIYGFRCAIVENCTFDDSVGCSLQFSAVERVEVRNCSFTNIGPRADERLSGGYNAINIAQIGGFYNWDTDGPGADDFYYFCEDAIIENCRIEKVCDVGITYLARNFICRNCYFNKVSLPFEPVDINGGTKTLYMSQTKLIENCQFYYCGAIFIPSPVQKVQDDDPTKNSSISIIRNNLIEHPNEWLEDGHTEVGSFNLFEIFSFGNGGRIIDSTCIIENNIVKNAPNIKGNIFNLINGGRCVIRGNTFEAPNSMHMVYAFTTRNLFIQNNYFECLSETGYMFSIKDVQLYVLDNNICIGEAKEVFVDRTGNGIIKITNNKFSTSHGYANISFRACDKIDVINNEVVNTGTNIGNTNFIKFVSEDFKSINIIGNKCEKLFNLYDMPSSVEKFIIRDNICSDFKNVGTTTERRALKLERAAYKALFKNFEFYDTDLNMGLVFNGDDFVSENGFTAARNRGTTAQRPVAMQNSGSTNVTGQLKSDRDVGFEYFDTDLSKPIYAKVIDNSTGSITWVDATGTTV